MKSLSLFRGLLSFSTMTMVSRVLGLVRDISISNVFGASMATDAFVIAFRIPNFMRRLFAEGSFSTAFVPVFIEVKETGNHLVLKALTAYVAGTLGGVLLVITALGLFFAPQLAIVFAPGALNQPYKFNLIVDLLRLTLPYLLFVSLTTIASSVLNGFHRFALPAMTPVMLNLSMIVGALWLASHLQVPVMALGWAVLLGGIVQLLWLLPALHGLNMLVLPRWGWHHWQVRRIMKLMVPTLFGASAGQINLLLDTVLLTLLVTGSQTWIYQSTRFLELPLGVFGIAMGTVILPTLARYHVTADRTGFSRLLNWGLRITLLIAVPAMFALILLGEPLVSTFFQHGQYTVFDARMTTLSMRVLAGGLPAYALVKIVLPAFYARQDTRTPVRVALVSLLGNMLFNLVLVALLFWLWATPAQKQLGWLPGIAHTPGLHVGLALASVLSSYIQFILLWRWLRRADVYDGQPGWLRHWLRLGISCAVMVLMLGVGLWCWPCWNTVAVFTRAWHLALLVLAGATAYAGTLWVCGYRLRDLRAP